MSYTFCVQTLGCQVNQYEGRALAEAMTRAGFTEATGKADIYIVNSCAVTAAAAASARRLAARAKRDNPNCLTVLAGCYPQVYRRETDPARVDLVVGTAGRSLLPRLIARRLSGEIVQRIQVVEPGAGWDELLPPAHYRRARPVLKIQEGCNEACTYCVVRLARGLPRSLEPGQVIARVQQLAEKGYREIILTGTHLGTYGRDFPGWSLARIVRETAGALAGDFRLRLDYVEPMDVSRDLLQAMAEAGKVCPFLYLPLQSGSDRVLGTMGRRYTADEYIGLVETARRLIPGLAVCTDLIAGFPGETAADHQKTISLVRRLAISRLHVFPYSPRPGTAASQFPDQVAPDVKKDRVRALRALDQELSLQSFHGLTGREVRVLVERVAGGTGEGCSEQGVRVRFPATAAQTRGSLVSVRVMTVQPWGVEGVAVDNGGSRT